MKRKIITFCLILLIWVAPSACGSLNGNTNTNQLTASGAIATDHVRVAPEIGGKVLELKVAEGDRVQAGDVLFRLDDELLSAQAQQAQAAVDLANTSVEAAKAQLSSAQVQYEMTVQQARLGALKARAATWTVAQLDEIELPGWYFEKSELLKASQSEVETATQNLNSELENLAKELRDASNSDFVEVETRLARAQMAYQIADQTLEQAQSASEKDTLEPAAQKQLDAAKADLDAVQLEYNRVLSSAAAKSILEVRARVAVARARLDHALDTLAGYQTGEDSLAVKAAQAAVTQAQSAITQATANQVQAQAALNLVELQLKRCVVTAPSAGVVLALNVKTGELVPAGSVALTLGPLDVVNLTVYVSEDQYGQVQLGQKVAVTVDSYPGKTFSGQVQSISDEAEFTPRNVQTVEGRKSTVYAVKITVPNPDQALKAGMPADVNFSTP